WRSGPDGRRDYCNGPWLRFTGRTLQEELGDGWTLGIHAADLRRRLDVAADSFRQRAPFEAEYRLRRHDGVYRWIFERGVPIREADAFGGFVGGCIDVHERHEGQVARESFLRMMAHELRTPLQAVKMFVEAMRRRAASGEPCGPEMFDRLDGQFDRFGRLISDLSQTGDAGGSSVRRTPLDLASLLRKAVESRSHALRDAPVRSRHQVAFRGPERAEVRGDSQRLEQAFHSVLDNALKFSPRGGVVDVMLQSAEGEHRVTVRDEGVGIPAAELPMVSHRFFRASNVSQQNFPGMGLGLSSARDVVEKHGGSLSVASQVGKGTEVSIVLPRSKETGP
ncbi:MAG: PAS domain-containing sensor histidine kinase, partial [Acidobacteriota bacterium]